MRGHPCLFVNDVRARKHTDHLGACPLTTWCVAGRRVLQRERCRGEDGIWALSSLVSFFRPLFFSVFIPSLIMRMLAF